MGHLLVVPAEALDEQGGQAVVMVGTIGLDVAVILVEAESGFDLRGRSHLSVAHQRFVMPRITAIAVVEDFGGARVEDHAVESHTPSGHHPTDGSTFEGLRVGRDFKAILLLRDGVGVAAVREGRDLVVRDAVGLDDTFVALDGDGYLILAGRLGVGFLEGRALGLHRNDEPGEQERVEGDLAEGAHGSFMGVRG